MTGLTKKQMTSANGLRIGSNAGTNIDQGGGDKKAGLVPMKNAPVMRWTALNVAQTRNTLYTFNGIFGLRYTRVPHKALKNVGSTYTPNTYFNF